MANYGQISKFKVSMEASWQNASIYHVEIGYVWVCMDIYEYLWVCMGIYGYVMVYMGMYGYIWVFIGMYEYI